MRVEAIKTDTYTDDGILDRYYSRESRTKGLK